MPVQPLVDGGLLCWLCWWCCSCYSSLSIVWFNFVVQGHASMERIDLLHQWSNWLEGCYFDGLGGIKVVTNFFQLKPSHPKTIVGGHGASRVDKNDVQVWQFLREECYWSIPKSSGIHSHMNYNTNYTLFECILCEICNQKLGMQNFYTQILKNFNVLFLF